VIPPTGRGHSLEFAPTIKNLERSTQLILISAFWDPALQGDAPRTRGVTAAQP